ncbi:hypothetical protein Tco_0495742 [Tanacetum coccineum]
MGEADVILGIKIKRENKGIVITQSHYIEKILKKFNREDCSPVNTPMDPVEKLKPNTGKPVDQLEYSRAIGCLMYAMTSTRPDIAYVVGRLSRFTSNPSRQHWKAITRVFKWMGVLAWERCHFMGFQEVNMESEFMALTATGKEAEWLRNLIYEIPIWPKPIAPISIRCDSVLTMAKAYSQVFNGKSKHLGIDVDMGMPLMVNSSIRDSIHRIHKLGYGVSSWIWASFLSVLEKFNTAYHCMWIRHILPYWQNTNFFVIAPKCIVFRVFSRIAQ